MGRPREFEPEIALEAIKDAFWRLGFDGASMQDLETATGLRKQSLYREFGDKRAMYLAALDHYERHEMAAAAEIMQQKGSARARFKRLFAALIDESDARGCFMCNAGVDQAPHNEAAGKLVAAMAKRWLAVFENALGASEPYASNMKKRAQKAAHLAATYMGMRVLIKSRAPESVLRTAADDALSAI